MSLRYVLGYSTKEYRYFRKILGDLAGFDVGPLRLRSSVEIRDGAEERQ
ncbi:hypothetical protein [Desulfurococcus sp.]